MKISLTANFTVFAQLYGNFISMGLLVYEVTKRILRLLLLQRNVKNIKN